jgi:F0F1-type ATP synthase assembly protein I
MNGRYAVRLIILVLLMVMVTAVLQWTGTVNLPGYNWIGLGFLVLITGLIHMFVHAAGENPNSLIRRLMIGSILRMFLGILFLAITLYNMRPVNLHFVIFYCAYFCVFMVFEISQMRTNLRPDSKPRPNNGNA